MTGPEDITPPVDAIRWEVTPGSLAEIAERYWEFVLPALKDLQREYEVAEPPLSERERADRRRAAVYATQRRPR